MRDDDDGNRGLRAYLKKLATTSLGLITGEKNLDLGKLTRQQGNKLYSLGWGFSLGLLGLSPVAVLMQAPVLTWSVASPVLQH